MSVLQIDVLEPFDENKTMTPSNKETPKRKIAFESSIGSNSRISNIGLSKPSKNETQCSTPISWIELPKNEKETSNSNLNTRSASIMTLHMDLRQDLDGLSRHVPRLKRLDCS